MELPREACERAVVVEVVRITDPVAAAHADGVVGEEIALWDGERVGEVLALVARIPEGERARCFLPAWGVRVHDDVGLVFEVAFCFRCNGARVIGRPVQGMDGDSREARELLALFRS